jgi:hypothetical protein
MKALFIAAAAAVSFAALAEGAYDNPQPGGTSITGAQVPRDARSASPAAGELAYSAVPPEMAVPGQSRAQVRAELDEALKARQLASGELGVIALTHGNMGSPYTGK